MSLGISQALPGDAAEIFSTDIVSEKGTEFFDFIDRTLKIVDRTYSYENAPILKGELQCTLMILVYLVNESKHYLAPSTSFTGVSDEKTLYKPKVAVELCGMSGYTATPRWLNTCMDEFAKEGKARPFWAYKYGKYNKQSVEKLYPKYSKFIEYFNKYNCHGYFSNDFTDNFFGKAPAHRNIPKKN